MSHVSYLKKIKQADLQELKALNAPAQAVKDALCTLLMLTGSKETDWNTVRGLVFRPNFMNEVANLDPAALSP